ncbi:MAG: hypothetical protein ABFD75_11315 [Smithella sp.]
MLNKVKTYIGNTPWDEVMQRQEERWINKVCWGIILASALYIIPICLNTLYEVKYGKAITKAVVTKSEKSGALSGVEKANQEMGMPKRAKQ